MSFLDIVATLTTLILTLPFIVIVSGLIVIFSLLVIFLLKGEKKERQK